MISQSAVHSAPHRTDIYVGRGFSEYEVAAVTRVLSCANEVRRSERFSWRYVSAAAGLVTGTCGMILRSEPAVDTYDLGQALVVTGGASGTNAQWMNRLRQMVRQARPVLVLSDAATAYLRRTRRASADVTTHWRDAVHLAETGRYPTLTGRLAATSDGVTTAAGEGATEEAVLSMLAPHIGSNALNRAVKAEYGISASKMRSSGGLKRLHGAPGKS